MSSLSFVSGAEKVVLGSYLGIGQRSSLAAQIVSRVAAVALLSLSAALDIVFHSILILPTCLYAVGKSVIQWQMDFTIPWQHLQRIRNAVAPLLLGSAFGLIHPYAGLFMSEPTDKHIVTGILSSNTGSGLSETPCSPVHSIRIASEIASSCSYVKEGGVMHEIFSEDQRNALQEAAGYEYSLEALQAQEFIHKMTNITLYAMAGIKFAIENSNLSDFAKGALTRLSGILVPILTAVDLVIVALTQAFFLATGIVRLISGRGPIYTESTTNPLMHVSFLIQNILKVVGNVLGTLVWFVSPLDGFRVSLFPPNLYFKIEMAIFLLRIKAKLFFMKEGSRTLLPVVFGQGECSAFSVPTHSMHKTYLIVEKKEGAFNLYWVNRPDVEVKRGLTDSDALLQISSMLYERFPFMDIEKMMTYPVESDKPAFDGKASLPSIAGQGSLTNCVVSNLFGALEVMDRLEGKDAGVTNLRNRAVRFYLDKTYGFYQDGFHPFCDGLNLKGVWDRCQNYPQADI